MRQTKSRAATNPRCVMPGPDLRPPASRADLMALTMGKDNAGASDVLLLVQTETRLRLFRWPFRARHFVAAPPWDDKTPLCTPTTPLPRA